MKSNSLSTIEKKDISIRERSKTQFNTFSSPTIDSFFKRRKNNSAAPMNLTYKLGAEPGQINSIWINKVGNRVAGLARLVQDGPHSACIVLFRIDPEWRHTKITVDLINSIQHFCQEHGNLDVRLLPHSAPPWMLAIMKQHGIRCEEKRRIAK